VSKYGARRVKRDGYMFDSNAEQEHYVELCMRGHAGEITDLKVHPRFQLVKAFRDVDGKKVTGIRYFADFSYVDAMTGRTIVEDVKGVQTPLFRVKAKLFKLAIKEGRFDVDFRLVQV